MVIKRFNITVITLLYSRLEAICIQEFTGSNWGVRGDVIGSGDEAEVSSPRQLRVLWAIKDGNS